MSGLRLVKVMREVRELNDPAAAARGTRRFWRGAVESTQLAAFTRRLKAKCQSAMFDPIASTTMPDYENVITD